MGRSIKILYVDDEVNNLNSFTANFRNEFDILTAGSGRDGLEILQNNEVQIIMSDYRMPEMDGVDFLAQTISISFDSIRILITDNSNAATVIEAVNRAQIYYFLTKPWDEEQLRTAIISGSEIYNLRAKNKELIELITDANDLMKKFLF